LTTHHQPTDIIVIGSGASGAAATWLLSQNGFRVVCLEQGRWINPADYPVTKANWQELARTKWAFHPNTRRQPADYPVNDDDSAIKVFMYNAVGGSTIHWAAHVPRFHPSDFCVKTLDGVADDWPISYWDLEPYYDLNDQMMGCSGIHGDPANPSRSPRQMPPIPLGPDGERMAQAFDRLGWHWWPSDNHVNSQPYKGRDACNHCGPNVWGCSRKAKASVDVTYLPEAIAHGAQVRDHSTVFDITTSANGQVTGARYYDAQGGEHLQPAKGVIVACNAVGTPRMLLHSVSDQHPQGLANTSGLVGKNLMFHVYASATGLFEESAPTYQGPLANILISQEFYETDPTRGFLRGYSLQMARSSGPANTAIANAAWGTHHHQDFATHFGKSTNLGVIGEDLPVESNRVTLEEKQRDRFGIPVPHVEYALDENSKRLLAHGVQQSKQALLEAGAHRVIETPHLVNAGWHLMGTARMGDDPARSVVNAYGQAHDVDNLFIIDGSVFVTSAGVNPTPTIQALALRTADYICRERTDLKECLQ
jgi:choline dehydrogenase-like flavoprotein